jgi:hypothetical protein
MTHDYYKPTSSASRGNISTQMYFRPPMPKDAELKQDKTIYKQVV